MKHVHPLFCCVLLSLLALSADLTAAQGKEINVPLSPLAPENNPALSGQDGAASPLKYTMYAMLAKKGDASGKSGLDQSLKPVEGVLNALKGYASFEKINVSVQELAQGAETRFPINGAYTMLVAPAGDDGKGSAQLGVRIQLLDNGNLINAIETQANSRPGEALVFQGMPLSPGELVVVLVRESEPGQQGGEGQDNQEQQQQQQQEKQSQQKEEEKEKGEEKEAEKQEAAKAEEKPAQEEKGVEKEQEKQDQNNFDAILESLEEMDRREQKDVHYNRNSIEFKGDWW